MAAADNVIILDFETTGLSPDMGDRAIEIAAVRLHDGEVVDEFQALMNPGRRVSGFIEGYTGITNAMLADARSCEEVMAEFAGYIGDANLVAHNASFDKRFLDAELARLGARYSGEFVCSMLLARRLYQQAPNHKLGSLADYLGVAADGTYHRALYDSQMTARLWLAMLDEIRQRSGQADVSFGLLKKLAKTPKHGVASLFSRLAAEH